MERHFSKVTKLPELQFHAGKGLKITYSSQANSNSGTLLGKQQIQHSKVQVIEIMPLNNTFQLKKILKEQASIKT